MGIFWNHYTYNDNYTRLYNNYNYHYMLALHWSLVYKNKGLYWCNIGVIWDPKQAEAVHSHEC